MSESTLHDRSIMSKAIGKRMRIRVVTPPDYDPVPPQPYPVIYLLHLWGRNERYWTDRLAVHLRLEEGIAAGTLPPLILAMPEGDKSFYLNAADPPGIDWTQTPYWNETEFYRRALQGYGNYGDYLLNEAIPFVERAYPVRTDRAGRAIGGLSQGAAGAAVHVFTDPSLFCAIGLHSPAVFRPSEVGIPWIFGLNDPAAFAARDPIQLAARLTPQNQPRIWIDCGWQDSLRDAVEDLHRVLFERGIAHDYHLSPGEHDGAYWMERVADYLRFYARDWATGNTKT